MTINVKFTKFDNTPWGFRLAGGSDFPHPLTVIKVLEGSLAECMGLKVGDVVVRLNDEPVSSLTHGQAHEALVRAGNNFVIGVKREEDPLKALEALNEENIVPYQIPLADLPPVFPEQILRKETPIEREEEQERKAEEEEERQTGEELPEKPKDADSEVVPNQNLTDDEIAQLILEEEELLTDQGLLGVNFKKLRPRVPVLRESKVVEELQHIATEAPPRVQELKHKSTFLQKPERPVPAPKKKEEPVQEEVEPYRVVIKKQQRRSVTDRLLEKGLLKPSGLRTPEPPAAEVTTPSATPDPGCRSDQCSESTSRQASRQEFHQDSRPESREESRQESRPESAEEERFEQKEPSPKPESPVPEEYSRKESVLNSIEREMADLASRVDKEKIKELVTTEINLEKQLENVQRQLLALKQLPSEIESHLRIVSEQLQKIMELSGVQNGAGAKEDTREEEEHMMKSREEERSHEEPEEQEEVEDLEDRTYSGFSDEPPRIIEPSDAEEEEDTETHELEGTLSVKSEEESVVKKYVVSYETKVLKSRDPSPAPSYGSFEPDPKLSPKAQSMQQKGRKRSQDLWPQAKQLELTLGRRWRCPNDFFNDEMIAEVLSSQAEVIRGRALGVNFKKYEKTNLPNYDHLMNSSVYKMIHKMEREPRRGIPARPAKVNAAEDIIERAKSPALSFSDDRSTRSVSH